MQRLRTGDPGQDNKRVRTSTADAAKTNGLRIALDFLAVLKKNLSRPNAHFFAARDPTS